MVTAFARKHVSGVEELVDPGEFESRSGEPVAAVFLSWSDGSQVAVSERGRELIEFILSALRSGLEVNVEAEDELLTPGAAAAVLGVARQSVYRWQDSGLLPVVMRGRARAVPATAVRELKVTRDSRALGEVADSLALQARAFADASDGPDNAQSAGDLFVAVQAALRSGQPTQAGRLWRTARAAQVAQQARHAQATFAADRES
jgi:excisionase family DNA binding protein